MEAKILRLTLNKKWFDMILSGEKKEEYREVKWYWIKRLTNQDADGNVKGKSFYKKFDFIEFVNGYNSNSQRMVVEFKGIEIGKGKPELGSENGIDYFVISLGKITDTKNIKN